MKKRKDDSLTERAGRIPINTLANLMIAYEGEAVKEANRRLKEDFGAAPLSDSEIQEARKVYAGLVRKGCRRSQRSGRQRRNGLPRPWRSDKTERARRRVA